MPETVDFERACLAKSSQCLDDSVGTEIREQVIRLLPHKPAIHSLQEGNVAACFDFARHKGFHAVQFTCSQVDIVTSVHVECGIGSVADSLGDSAFAVLDGHMPVAATLSRDVELDGAAYAARSLGAKGLRHCFDPFSRCLFGH